MIEFDKFISQYILMVYGYTSIFFHYVFKGRNIGDCLFAYLEDEVFSKWGQVLWEEFASVGANSCPYKMTPFYMGGNYDNDRVGSPESVSIHLNESCCIFSTDLFFPLYILYCSHVWFHRVSMTWHSNSKSYVD